MSKIYIVKDCYAPSTAPTNRMMGFIKEFSNSSIDVDVVFFMPDFNKRKAPIMPHVTYHYYWKYIPSKINFIRFLTYLFLYVYIFAYKVKPGDKVLLLGCDSLVPLLARKRNVKVFHERTEHTYYSRVKFLDYERYFKACAKIDGLFLISDNLRQHYINNGVPSEKITIVNMTVDIDRFINVEKECNERYIAYCGNASNNKDGVDQLIRAFSLIVPKYPDVRLYIIGKIPGNKQKFENYELVKNLGIEDRVVFTGVIAPTEMPRYLSNATILALDRPDNIQAKYGFPTKLGEYLLTGNPVAITNVGNISDFLKNKVNAMIAMPDDQEAFAANLVYLLDNPELAKEMGLKGRTLAMEEFNNSIETRKIIKVIENL